MTAFTEATRIIGEFVRTYCPPIQDEHRSTSVPQNESQENGSGASSMMPCARVPLLASLGRKSCSTVQAPIQMPLFDNSAMDGYALRSWQTASASLEKPLKFRVVGMIAAGDEPPIHGADEDELKCWGIMTGAPFPLASLREEQNITTSKSRFDACIKLELVSAHYDSTSGPASTSRTPTHITLTTPVPQDANRRNAGEDIRVGDVLLRQDEVIRKEHVMVLASMGVQDVEVREAMRTSLVKGRRRLKIGIINTGKEVVLKSDQIPTPSISNDTTTSADLSSISGVAQSGSSDLRTPASSSKLGISQIWNSNGPYIHASLLTWGFHPDDISVLTVALDPGQDGDDPLAFQRLIHQAITSERPYDVLISTGGVSTGVHDYVPSSIVGVLGGELGFHKLKMRPGGPMMFAHLANAAKGRTAYFGLPGNPVAAAVCLRFLVVPALMQMCGEEAHEPQMRQVRIRAQGNSVEGRVLVQRKPPHTRMYVPARLRTPIDKGPLEVEALARGSNMTKGLMHADGWVCLVEGEGRDEVYDGDSVELYGLDV